MKVSINSRFSLPNVLLILFIISSWMGCEEEPKSVEQEQPKPVAVKVPPFDRDSAFAYVEKQLSFGPRVPNTPGHTAAKEWFVQTLERFGLSVQEQNFTATDYWGKTINGTNIIAQYQPQQSRRLLLAAHWDSRQIADSPLTQERQDEAIPGADDGGSGVAVLLEVARQLQANPVGIGVDIILFDAEDQGEPFEVQEQQQEQIWWCLGSQHWSKNPHSTNFEYGVLLDMVGAKNARFAKEGYSRQFAGQVVNKVWKLARQMSLSNYFVDQNAGGVTDDHIFVNSQAGIPMIDIINLQESGKTSFGDHWHTHQDDLSVIDPRTLGAVGQLVLALIYREAAGTI